MKKFSQYLESHFFVSGIIIFTLLFLPGLSGCGDKQPFTFSVAADIQYSDKDTRINRHYRESIERLKDYVEFLNNGSHAFMIQLGDVIDGHSDDANRSAGELEVVLGVLDKLQIPAYHVVGNHCMSAGEDVLKTSFSLDRFFYDFSFPGARGWRFVVIDGNDAGYGIVSEGQVKWFRSVLIDAAANDERVLVFSHYALLREAAANHRMAQPDPLLEAMDETGNVAAWFAGHDHAGGYAYRNGVHHLTLKGMVESPVNNAYISVELLDDMIRITGYGDETSRDLLLE